METNIDIIIRVLKTEIKKLEDHYDFAYAVNFCSIRLLTNRKKNQGSLSRYHHDYYFYQFIIVI